MTTTTNLPEVHTANDRSTHGDSGWMAWKADGPRRSRKALKDGEGNPTMTVCEIASFEDIGATLTVYMYAPSGSYRGDDCYVVLGQSGPSHPRPIAWVNGGTVTDMAAILAWAANEVIEDCYDEIDDGERRVRLVLDPQATIGSGGRGF